MTTPDRWTATTLVIGIGNTLRGDDAAGYQVAEIVECWGLAGVRSRAVHQLTPDLAAEMAEVDRVIFVDVIALNAIPSDPQRSPASPDPIIEMLEPNSSSTFTGHYLDPRSLLFLSNVLYHQSPIAYQVLIPAIQFEFGEVLSAITQQSVKLAVEKVHQLLVN